MIQSPSMPTATAEDQVLALHAEELSIEKRTVARGVVRVSKVTHTHDQTIHETLVHHHVEVDRVPIGTYVDAAPPVRQEGDVTILSVVEEVLVTERRLLLKEEVHVRRVQTVRDHVETVALRVETAIVERIPTAEPRPGLQVELRD